MFKWIFFSLIFTPCLNYSKNNVIFLLLSSSELLQKLLKLNRIVCCFKLLFYFRIIFVALVELEVVADSKTIFDNLACKIYIQVFSSWNDRRSRRVFLCFYSAIFKLTSARFQTFAYNSRTVWSNYMKF